MLIGIKMCIELDKTSYTMGML